MQRIPASSPDVTALILPIIRAGVDSGTKVRSKRPELSPPYELVLVRADLQNHVTPISRYCRVGLTTWVVDSAGKADIGAEFDLSIAAGHALMASSNSLLLDVEWQSGPIETSDDISKLPIAYSTLLLEVALTI